VLIRLARHFSDGYKRGDNIVTIILRRFDIYILPAVEMAGFDVLGREDLLNKEAS